MQCPECGSEWKASNRIDLIQRCPFCGASLEKEAPRQITFTNAKEGVRYIVDNFGSDVIVDNEQFTKLLNKFMPKLKQERKVIVEAMNEGVCTTLYDATDQSEIDKCIAILQSIKILTQDACMAEKWACYAVETIVYALGWSVPMFGITPNIHMYQIPETVSHPWSQDNSNEVWVQPDKVWVNPVESNGDTWDDKNQEVIEVSEDELNKSSNKNQFPVYEPPIFEQPSENDKSVEQQAEKSNETNIESPIFEVPTEETEEPVIESPVFEAPTEETEEPVIESPVFEAPTEKAEEPVIESPVFEAPTEETEEPVIESPVFEPPTEETKEPVIESSVFEPPVESEKKDETPVAEKANEENQQNTVPQQPPFGHSPEQQYNPWGMPPQQGAEGQQPPYNPWGMPPQPNTQQAPANEPAPQPIEEAQPEVEKEPEPQPVEKENEPEPVVETKPEPEAPFIPQPESTAKKNDVDIDQYMNAPWAVHNRENNRSADVKPIDIPTNSTGTTDRTNGFSVSNAALQQETPISAEPSVQTPAESHEPIHKVDLSSLNVTPSDEPIAKPSMESTPVVEIPQPEAAPVEETRQAEDIVINIPEPSVPETSSTNKVFTKEDASKFTLNHVQIPEGVIRIDDEAFKDNQKIEAVVLPKSLKEIGDSAFEGCIKLITINIPDSVTEIGKCAFKGCSSITSIKLPNSITRINAECFGGCERLKDFKIPASVNHISRHAFMNCTSITDIEIPDGVHGLAENIFSGCKSLQTIKVPDSVSQIHKNCFSWCESLTTINLPEAVTEIAPGSFTGCEKLKTLDIPSRVTKIGYGAFSKCTGLKSLTLPDTITEIEENAFLGCRALVVYCSPENAYIKRYCRLNRVRCKSNT